MSEVPLYALRSSVLGSYHVIRKEAGFFCRTSSSVRLWWELEEPKEPKGGQLSKLAATLTGLPRP